MDNMKNNLRDFDRDTLDGLIQDKIGVTTNHN
jgi:hypothetical protein